MVLVGYGGAEMLDIACPSDVFDSANRLGARRAYAIELASVDGGAFRCQSGLRLVADRRLDQVRGPVDTLVVAGGRSHEAAAADPRLIAQVRRLARLSRRVASVCTGATVLAEAGLLNGRRATTHWAYAEWLAARYPQVRVDAGPLFIRDGRIATAAGITSALDLALAFVEEDEGASLAREVARRLVTYMQRPSNQAQISALLSAPPPEHGVVRDLAAHVTAHPGADLSTPVLAARAGVSPRQLARLFEAHLHTTPSRYVRTVRTEAAARLLETTSLPLAAIARRCGFGSTETLRTAFLDYLDATPSNYRRLHRRTPAPE
ncbi:GlxA family transcriptional regulator [Glycomyces tritici]